MHVVYLYATTAQVNVMRVLHVHAYARSIPICISYMQRLLKLGGVKENWGSMLCCLAHSLNLCLQDAGRKVHLLRYSIVIVREIVGLTNYSPKREESVTK